MSVTNTALKAARHELGLTVEQAALVVGIRASYWNQIENAGRSPSMKLGFRMAQMFGKTLDDLFAGFLSATDEPYRVGNLVGRAK